MCVCFFLVWLIKCLSHFGVNIKGWHLTLFSNYAAAAAAAAKSLQLCLTLCNPVDSSSPGSPVPGILQARILEWVAISFSFLPSVAILMIKCIVDISQNYKYKRWNPVISWKWSWNSTMTKFFYKQINSIYLNA